jgi:hypothetical protein
MLSQLTTDGWTRPLATPTATSVVRLRTRLVIGATVNAFMNGRA